MEIKKKRLIDMDTDELKDVIRSILNEESPEPPQFITTEETLKLLNCGRTTLYTLRINSDINFVQDDNHRGLILYERESIIKYLKKHLKTKEI